MKNVISGHRHPTFVTGRHGWTALVVGVCTVALISISLPMTIQGQFWGSPTLRYLRIPELLGVLGVFCVGVCLLPGMPSFEMSPNRRIRGWYIVSVFVACSLPVVAAVIIGLLIKLHIHPVWRDVQDELSDMSVLPHWLASQAYNAMFVGACVLIAMRFWGILAALASTVLIYPILLWESAQQWADMGPYAAQWVAVVADPHVIWPVVTSLLAGYVWARRTGSHRSILAKLRARGTGLEQPG